MYTLDLSDGFMDKFIAMKAEENYPSITVKITLLCENPINVAVPTGIPIFCQYYVNAGKNALLFDIDTINKVVLVRTIMNRAKLYKILIGKINQSV